MVRRIVCSIALLLGVCSFAFAQENITITTYYPSPFGSYNDLSVYRDLVIRDRAGTSANMTISSDAAGNIAFNNTMQDQFPQVLFSFRNGTGAAPMVQMPFAYLLRFVAGAGITYCARGYVAVGYLDDGKMPVDPNNMPTSGYISCMRGWE